MSRFYVGQRVRLVRAANPELQYLIGQEGVLLRRCTVFVDSWDVDVNGNNSRHVDGTPYSWAVVGMEPITDSYDKIEWSDCIWQPEHTRVSA